MSRKNILIVDDEQELAEILRIHLQKEGYAVVTAGGVDKALQLLEKGPVDLVLLDIMMPDKDCFDFLWAVSTKHGRPKVPVIVMTTRGEFESLMEGIAVDGFVQKPFEMPRLLEEVKKVLSLKKKAVCIADVATSPQAQAVAKELEDERYHVFFVQDADGFKKNWRERPADYIVMEYEQDSMTGEDMIREIRKCAAVPLIVYSCSGMDFREKSLEAGASAYLGKPQDPAAIVTAIREFEMKK